MSRRTISSLTAIVVVLVVIVAAVISRKPQVAEAAIADSRATAAALEAYRSQSIALFERRAKEDPWSAGDQMILAQLYLQRSRETGSHEDVLLAEVASRKSLDLRLAHNVRAHAVLAMSLLEQHRFKEAYESMSQVVAAEPENVAFRASLGEILLELGEYGRADTVFNSLQAAQENLDVAPRLARWLEIRGASGEALALLYRARDRAVNGVDLGGEQLAWFHLRLGDLELRNGRLDEAERLFRDGLGYLPDDYRLLSAMARLHAARGDWDAAIRTGEQVLGRLLDPNTLVLLSEVHSAKGETIQADEYANILKVAIRNQTMLHRQWSLFLVDRGENVPEVLDQTVEELNSRRDVYGLDLLAWALHKSGRHAEAGELIAEALEVGIHDALLFYHAGMIQAALGNEAKARTYLNRALEINPYFHPLHAGTARAHLASTGTGRLMKWLRL